MLRTTVGVVVAVALTALPAAAQPHIDERGLMEVALWRGGIDLGISTSAPRPCAISDALLEADVDRFLDRDGVEVAAERALVHPLLQISLTSLATPARGCATNLSIQITAVRGWTSEAGLGRMLGMVLLADASMLLTGPQDRHVQQIRDAIDQTLSVILDPVN